MTTFYVVDTTTNPRQLKQFQSYPQIVQYLEGMSQRAYGQNRKQRMILLEEVGHYPDDASAVSFVRSMAEAFEMGVIREGVRRQCDISIIPQFQKQEFGD